jgi:serine/threonine protein kinase
MAFTPQQQLQLEREHTILDTIRARDTHSHHSQFIVTSLFHGQDRFLTNESDNLYSFNEAGELSPLPFPSPMQSLVFESGGLNLREFMSNRNHLSVAVVQRVQIMEDVVRAVNFLHELHIVHFDLKPDNVVCFSSVSDSVVRWKLIDFDSSCDVLLAPPDSAADQNRVTAHVPVISFPSPNIRVTEAYTCPEIMRILNYNNDHPSAPPPPPVEVNWRVDIWSLGMIGFFVFTNHSLWEVLHNAKPFKNSMVSGVTQEQIQLLLSRSVGPKEKAFIESCLQVTSGDRKKASQLLQKSLFSTDNSTIHSNFLKVNTETMEQRFVELQKLITRYKDESQSLVCDDLEMKFSEFYLCLICQLERIHHLTPEEVESLRQLI